MCVLPCHLSPVTVLPRGARTLTPPLAVAAPMLQVKVYFLDGSCKVFDISPSTSVGVLLSEVKVRLGIAAANAFALYQVQRGTHYLLHESAMISEIRSATDSRAKALGMKERRPKLLFKKYLFTRQDERLGLTPWNS